jgi:hypothetical protein
VYAVVAMPLYALALRGDEWYREWSFFVAALVTVFSLGEAIRISLIDDARWDARFNRDSGTRSRHGVGPVLVAIVALMLGAILGMSVLALFLERILTPAA